MASEQVIVEFLNEFDRLFVRVPERDRLNCVRLFSLRGPEHLVYGLSKALWLQGDPGEFTGRSYHLGLLSELVRQMKGLAPFKVCPECGKLNVELSPEHGIECSVCRSVVERWFRSEIPTISGRYWPVS